MRSIAVTGHRTYLLGGDDQGAIHSLLKLASDWLATEKPSEVISGLADGWDIIVAQAALKQDIPLVAALAYRDDTNFHRPDLHEAVLAQASEVYAQCEKKVQGCYTKRDNWVLQRGDVVLAMSSGAPGGTARAVVKARDLGKPIANLWDDYIAVVQPEIKDLISQRTEKVAQKQRS